ncbi:MAG: hypothetical protein HN509_02155 [Halobacteriovoraceae bacterium]|nr:hypothetical protein [Halobacteriovoraceae bacterium]MBT5093734.1 hypothetical protein [Halobacteriovoraceae bacterium]
MSFLLDRKKLTKWFLGSLLAVTPLLIFFVWNFSKAKSGQVWPGFSDEFFSLKPMDILGNLFNIFYFNFLKVNYRFLITLPLIGFLGFQINNALKTKVWSLPPVLTATIFGSSLLCLGFSPYLVMERNILPFLFGYYLLLFYILELHVKSRYLPLLVTIILTLSFIPQYHPKVPVHEELNKTPIVVKAIAQDGRTYSYRDEIRVTKMAVEFLEKHRDKNLYVTWPFDLVLSDPFYGYTFKKYSNIFPKVSPFKKRVNAPAPDLLLVSNFSTPLNLQEQQIDIEKFKMRPLRTFKANGRYIVLFTK